MNQDDYEKFEELLQLRHEIDNQLNDIKDNANPDDYNKLMKLKVKLDKKHNHKSVRLQLKEANVEYKFLSFYKRFLIALQVNLNIDPGRLVGITDGIFGGVMTLLIFGLALPNLTILTEMDLSYAIESLIPNIGITIISFILLGSFWIYHHNFIKLKNLNLPTLWFNIFFLIFISFIPFTTSLIGTYSYYIVAANIFALNIFFTILSLTLMYWYSNKSGLMENEVSSYEKKYTYNTFMYVDFFSICNYLRFKFFTAFNLFIPVSSSIFNYS